MRAGTALMMGSVGASYCAEAIAYFNELTGTVPDLWKSAVNTFILAEIGSGNWAKTDGYYIHAAPNAQNATVNLKNPTGLKIITVNSPTFTANLGYTGNGSSSYINYQFKPATHGVNFTRNSAAFGAFVTNSRASANTSVVMGLTSGTNICYLNPNFSGLGSLYAINCASNITGTTQSTRGLHLATITSSGVEPCYKDSSLIVTGALASQPLANIDFYGLSRNNAATPSNFSSDTIALSIFASGTINVPSLNTSVSNLQTAIGF